MRCKICDELMNDYESSVKDIESGQYKDICTYCHAMGKEDVLDTIEDENDFLDGIDFTSEV